MEHLNHLQGGDYDMDRQDGQDEFGAVMAMTLQVETIASIGQLTLCIFRIRIRMPLACGIAQPVGIPRLLDITKSEQRFCIAFWDIEHIMRLAKTRNTGAMAYFRKPSDLEEFLKLGQIVKEAQSIVDHALSK